MNKCEKCSCFREHHSFETIDGKRTALGGTRTGYSSETSTQKEIIKQIKRLIVGFTHNRYEDYEVNIEIKFID